METSYLLAPLLRGTCRNKRISLFTRFILLPSPSLPLSLIRGPQICCSWPGAERELKGREADHLESEREAHCSGERAGRRGLRLRSDQPNAKTMSIHERAERGTTLRTTSRSRQKGSEIQCDANAVIESRQIYGVHYARARPQWCCYSAQR